MFITTGRFSQGALKYIREVPVRIVAIDGELLTRLMIRFRVGVQIRQTYDVMEIDEDFFDWALTCPSRPQFGSGAPMTDTSAWRTGIVA